MICMYCGLRRCWPEDFPHHLYAICSDCYPAWSGAQIDGEPRA